MVQAGWTIGPVARLAGRVAGARSDTELASLLDAFSGVQVRSLKLADVLTQVRSLSVSIGP
jgi:hypothetical protein